MQDQLFFFTFLFYNMHKGQWMKKQKDMTATDDLEYH